MVEEVSVKRILLDGVFVNGSVAVERSEKVRDAVDLLVARFFGMLEGNTLFLNLCEALYLIGKGRLDVKLSFDDFAVKAQKFDKRFLERFFVFRALRDNGYILKSALKYGADFSVYSKGAKPGKSHSRWLLFVSREDDKFFWRNWVANNRVAHSVKKKILIAVVDGKDITFYEVNWKKL